MIFHVAVGEEWEKQKHADSYAPDAYESGGFIHCCGPEQLEGVLQRYFSGQTGLLLLHIDTARLNASLRYERSTGNEYFPHVFGRINKNAIVKIEELVQS